MFAQLLVPLLCSVQLIAASSPVTITDPVSAFSARGIVGVLGTRQTAPPAQVPTACTSNCSDVENQVAAGPQCNTEKCCEASFVTEYFDCLECIGGALNVTDYTEAQAVLDDLTVQCDVRGLNAPKLTLPGIDPNRPLPSEPATALLGSTMSGIPTGTGSAPSQPTATSSAKADRLFTLHFSPLPTFAILLGGFAYFVI